MRGRPHSSLRRSLKANHQCVNPTVADFSVLEAATKCCTNSLVLGHPHTDPNSDRADSLASIPRRTESTQRPWLDFLAWPCREQQRLQTCFARAWAISRHTSIYANKKSGGRAHAPRQTKGKCTFSQPHHGNWSAALAHGLSSQVRASTLSCHGHVRVHADSSEHRALGYIYANL